MAVAFTIVQGPMGSGKSYFGAELCLAAARRGSRVFTNLPLNLDAWASEIDEVGIELSHYITILPPRLDSVVRLERRQNPDGSEAAPLLKSDFLVGGIEAIPNLVVLDEASLQFDIDEQMSGRAKNKPVFQLVALCRHLGLDMYFLAQHAQNVDAKLRRLAERRIGCRNVKKLPLFGWLLAARGDFLRTTFVGQSNVAFMREWVRFNPLVGSLYKTHGMLDQCAIQIQPGRAANKDASQFKGKFVLIALAIIALSLFAFAGASGSSLLSKYIGSSDKKSVEPAQSKLLVQPAAIVPVKSPPVLPDDFEVQAIFWRGTDPVFYSGGSRYSLRSYFQGRELVSWSRVGNEIFIGWSDGKISRVVRPKKVLTIPDPAPKSFSLPSFTPTASANGAKGDQIN